MIKINKNDIHITVIDLTEEYKNHDIPVRWAIVSNLSEKEIKNIFRDEIESYCPFIKWEMLLFRIIRITKSLDGDI